MRTKQIHTFEAIENFKSQLLNWSQQFEDVVWLDSNNYKQHYSSYDAILAVDGITAIQTDYHKGFEKLKEYYTTTNDWVFGYIAYDLKNDVEALTSKNYDALGFSDLYFFQPKKIFLIKGNQVETLYLNGVCNQLDQDLESIKKSKEVTQSKSNNAIKIKLRTPKASYFKKVKDILTRIKRGAIYETNFCQEFYAENTSINPLETYKKLNTISKPPFASFFKADDKYILCASPERYIKKEANRIISQPIKGTAKRSQNKVLDNELKNNLLQDEKERSENIMIVDLVRNDLSKTALKGSVKVNELCKIYTFDQVHQMISTVTSQVASSTHPIDIIKSTFPMGSMTGAPKIAAMTIMEDLEDAKRGVYSGAIGYIKPNSDFDFNVVIRSILYNATTNYVSYSVGGAITAKSDPLMEYEECLIKAKAMRTVLEG